MRIARAVRNVAVALLGCAPATSLAGATEIAAGRYRVLYAEPAVIQGLAPQASHAWFDAYGRRFDLILESNARLLAGLGETEQSAAAKVQLFRGSLRQAAGSWARLAVVGDRLSGMVWDGRDLYVIEPAVDVAPRAVNPLPVSGRKPVIYRLSDTQSDDAAGLCTTLIPEEPGVESTALDDYRALVGSLEQTAAAVGIGARLQVSALADYEYFQFAGSAEAARGRIAAILNDVDGIFGSQVGVQIELAGDIEVFADPADPFTKSDATELLVELAGYRVSQKALRGTGVTHLVTGRDLAGSTVGVAYLGSLCTSRFGASLSQGTTSLVPLVVAHELGHNFGAPHDGEAAAAREPANPCEATPRTFLMAPQLNGSDRFSQCSLEQMAPEIAAAGCMLPVVGIPDLALSTSAVSVSVTSGELFELAAIVANRGPADAASVELAFTLPNGLVAISGAATGGGSCVTQAGGLVCTWPALGAGTSSTASVDLRAEAAGTYTVPATLTAAADASIDNDAVAFVVSAMAPGAPPQQAPSGSGRGGGGSTAGNVLPAFLVLLLARRRIRRNVRTDNR